MSRLFRNSLRRVFRTFGRFLAITAIIAISCAFYSGVKAAAPEMKTSAWKYYSDTALADVHIMSSLGFNSDDADYILRTKHDFDKAYAGYSADLFTDGMRGSCVMKVMSFTPEQPLNRIIVTEGRSPIAPDEIVCDNKAGEDLAFRIGDKVRFYAPDDEDINDILNVTEFTVVGLVSSPLYVTDARGHSQIGTGEITSYAYIHPAAFAYDAYTDIYLTVRDAKNAAPFSEYYESTVRDAADDIENSSQVLLDRRRDRIRKDAEDELNDARKKLDDARKEYKDGKAEYEKGLAEYEDAKAQIEGKQGELSEYTGSVEEAMREIDDKTLQMQDLAETCTFIDKFLTDYENTYLQTLPLPLLDSFKQVQASYDANSVDAQIQELLAIYVITDPKTDPGTRQTARDGIIAVNEQVRQATAAALAELDVKREEVRARSEEINDAGSQMIDAQKELRKARTELDKAEKELADGEKKLNDAQEELLRAENELEDRLADGKIYVTDRNDFDPDCMSYGMDCDRVDSIAAAFPVFFVLIAALVCCATMTRMVEENRGEAGTLKALGYSSFSILMQYVLYAAAASVIGSAAGLVAGFRLLPSIIFDCYATMYNFPAFEPKYDAAICTGCAVVSLLCTSLSAVYAAAGELGGMPAVLIRPKPPRSGKRIFLEKFPALWSRMPFLRKVSFRNLFRYKSRFFLMLVGIGGCTALLLTAFGLKYAISTVLDRQYGNIFTYSAIISLDEDITDEERQAADDAIRSLGIYDSHMYAFQKEKDVSASGRKEEAYIFAPADSLEGFISLKDASTGRDVPLYSGGAVITEKLALMLGIKAGDEIRISGAAQPVEVYAVVKNHIGHYVYMSSVTYEELFGESSPDTVLLRTSSVPDKQGRNAVTEKLIACDGVISAVFMQDGLSNFTNLISSLDLIVLVIIAFVGALSLVILLNLAEINITERRYELATIKVLGFFDSEVGTYVYRENTITTVLGIIIGLLVGIVFERFVIVTAEVSSVMFMRDLAPTCFVWTVLLMAAFVLIVNILIFFRLKGIDMASSMKATE